MDSDSSSDDSVVDSSIKENTLEKPNVRKWEAAMFSPKQGASGESSIFESPIIARPSKRLDDTSSAKKKNSNKFDSSQSGEEDTSFSSNWWTSSAKDVDSAKKKKPDAFDSTHSGDEESASNWLSKDVDLNKSDGPVVVISSSEDDEFFDPENINISEEKEVKDGDKQDEGELTDEVPNSDSESTSPDSSDRDVGDYNDTIVIDSEHSGDEGVSDTESESTPPNSFDHDVADSNDTVVIDSEHSGDEGVSDSSAKSNVPKTPGGTKIKPSRSSPTFNLLLPEDQEINNNSETRINQFRAERIKLQCDKKILVEKKDRIMEKVKNSQHGTISDYQIIKTKHDMKRTVRQINSINHRIKDLNKLIGDRKDESETVSTLVDDNAETVPTLVDDNVPLNISSSPKSIIDLELPDKNIVLEPQSTSNLPKANMDLNSLGKAALATHNTQQTLTAEALGTFHVELLECATLGQEIEEPSGLKVSLLPHQKEALRWMVWRETKKTAGGILADDMGLGKTLTTISLILRSKENNQRWNSDEDSDDESYDSRYPHGGTLVIAPASVMAQWEAEVDSKVQRNLLSVLQFHGPKKESNPRKLARYDIVITTYPTMQKQGEESPLYKIRWKRVILDEAHIIRNHTTQTAQAVFKLRRKFVWALTGTPIHNKELDFYSLMKFLKCKPFNDLALWKKWIDNKDPAGQSRLNTIIKTILLRRTKAEIQSAGGLKSLKTKEFSIIRVNLEGREMKVYEAIALFSGTVFANYIAQQAEKERLLHHGMPVGNLRQLPIDEDPFKDHPHLARLFAKMRQSSDKIQSHEILVLLLRLRQMCCHPSLAVKILDKSETEIDGIKPDQGSELADDLMNLSIAEDDLVSRNPVFDSSRISSKVKAVVECVRNIFETSPGDKIIVVSQWTSFLNVINSFLKEQRISTVSLSGEVKVKDRASIIKNFNNSATEPKVMLLSLTAGGTGLNLVGANHLLMADIHWNPQLEAQASDRVYRVGQTKTVNIYKFICVNTIEEQIEALQLKKLQLAKDVLSGHVRAVSSKLTLQDLKTLFKVA